MRWIGLLTVVHIGYALYEQAWVIVECLLSHTLFIEVGTEELTVGLYRLEN